MKQKIKDALIFLAFCMGLAYIMFYDLTGGAI